MKTKGLCKLFEDEGESGLLRTVVSGTSRPRARPRVLAAQKTTAEMQTASTFLDAGWDFVDETENGTDDIWWILEGQDYPRLWWEMVPEN